jgi:hypothetical protein
LAGAVPSLMRAASLARSACKASYSGVPRRGGTSSGSLPNQWGIASTTRFDRFVVVSALAQPASDSAPRARTKNGNVISIPNHVCVDPSSNAERTADSRQKLARYIESLDTAADDKPQHSCGTIYGLAYLTELHEGPDPRFTGCRPSRAFLPCLKPAGSRPRLRRILPGDPDQRR